MEQQNKDLVNAFLGRNGVYALPKPERLAAAVQAVAGIPWGEGRTIEEVLATKKVGTCTGKHLVLQACFDELEIKYRTVVCTFRWGEQGIIYPAYLKSILAQGEWEHGHNFLQIGKGRDKWADIDVTWNPGLAPYGFRTFPVDWDGLTSFVGLDRVIRRWDGADIREKKGGLIDSLSPELRVRRELFLRAFIKWVDSINMPSLPGNRQV